MWILGALFFSNNQSSDRNTAYAGFNGLNKAVSDYLVLQCYLIRYGFLFLV